MTIDSTDYHSLCAELADSVELLLEMRPKNSKPMQITEDRLNRARSALSKPIENQIEQSKIVHPLSDQDIRILIKPIPASKELPKVTDCEPKLRYCWWYNYEDQAWYYCDASYCDLKIWTHWLPYWYLPIPTVTEI